MNHKTNPVAPLVRVLVVDSRAIVQRGLCDLIDAARPLLGSVGTASSYGEALQLTELLRPEIVILGLFPDPLDASHVLNVLAQRWGVQVQILAEDHDRTQATKLMELGACGAVPLDSSGDVIVRELIRVSHLANDPAKVWLGSVARLPIQLQKRSLRHQKEHAQLADLTDRERAVVRAIVSNPSAKYITVGAMLGVGEHTVHNHLTSIYQKLNLTSKIELLVYASRHQVGSLEDH